MPLEILMQMNCQNITKLGILIDGYEQNGRQNHVINFNTNSALFKSALKKKYSVLVETSKINKNISYTLLEQQNQH